MIHSPTGFFVADIETDPFKWKREVKPFASGVSDGVVSQLWWGAACIPDLLRFLSKKEGICYFHNGGKFDLHHLLPHMAMRDIDKFPFMMGSRIVVLKWKGIEFRDSYSLVPVSLGKAWGKDEIDIRKLEAHRRERHRLEIEKYLRADLSNLHAMLTDLFERYSKGKAKPLTLAGLSFRIMERDFGIKIVHTSRGFDRKFRRYYFGGRVDFWKLGRIRGDLRILDINSAYPRAMLEDHFWGEEYVTSSSKVVDVHSFYRLTCAAANGCFPRRTKDGVTFPAEGGKYYVTGWELKASKGVAKGIKIEARHRPENFVNFGPYVRHFYALKSEAETKGARQHAKLLLNAPYGKLAQNDENYTETQIRPYRKKPRGKGWSPVSDDKGNGMTLYQRPAAGFSRPYCVAAGASITGYVRASLFGVIRRNPRTLYCDTDSLISHSPIHGADIGERLGEWKEEMRCDVVWIAGKKLYAAHNARAPWLPYKPARTGWVHVEGLGWTPRDKASWEATIDRQGLKAGAGPRSSQGFADGVPEPWKLASKGVRLPVHDIIAVAEGHARTYRQQAQSLGLGRAPVNIEREVRRADKRKGGAALAALVEPRNKLGIETLRLLAALNAPVTRHSFTRGR